MMRAVSPAPTFSARGFTLTEMAVVMVILALLIGGMMIPLSTQSELRSIAETTSRLANIHEAILGFAGVNGRLPCPDTNLDGIEDLATSSVADTPVVGQTTQSITCASAATPEGDLPFATLGTARLDSWGRRFHYRVAPDFAKSSVVLDASNNVLRVTSGFAINTPGNITVQGRGDNPLTTGTMETKAAIDIATAVPAVVISHGKNGYGARTDAGTLLTAAATGTDEFANADPSTPIKFSRTQTASSSPCSDTTEGGAMCEFDDLVVWVSRSMLMNRLLTGGRLAP